MKRQILTGLLVLLALQGLAGARVWHVPSEYSYIQSAITASHSGDVILVSPGTYDRDDGGINRDINLDFAGKAITLQSEINLSDPNNPDIDWNTIANTVIDCGGSRYMWPENARRAFWFHSGESSNSKVIGFTIKNGYVRSPDTPINGTFGVETPNPYETIDPCDTTSPPRAERGRDTGSPYDLNHDGYGGAILCESSSPTIQYCIISNSTVTGGQGGDSANGQSGPWCYRPPPEDPNEIPDLICINDGQWGGYGGDGYGNGYGGAIACKNGSSPYIIGCIIKDNMATGGVGGNGGNGGNAAGIPGEWAGNESGSGSAGIGHGDGKGGAIYCETNSNAKIIDCTFSNNLAIYGIGGTAGVRGLGNTFDDPPQPLDGTNGIGYPLPGTGGGKIYGGAACYINSDPNFDNCKFTNNRVENIWYDPYGIPYINWWYEVSATGQIIWHQLYTRGGALYSGTNNTVVLNNNCEFTGNTASAVYCETGNNLTVDNCSFSGNTDTWYGGAIFINAGGRIDVQNSIFAANFADEDGGAIFCLSEPMVINNCSFGGNTADYGYGGAIYGWSYFGELNNCIFGGNQSAWGGGIYLREFAGPLTNCHFSNNTAGSGGAITSIDGTVSITDSSFSENTATDYYGYGGGIDCYNTDLTITNSTITRNSADGGNGTGGGISLYIGDAPLVKNCLITGNTADVGGGIAVPFFADPNIINCTFYNNSAAQQGGAVFCGSTSQTTIVNSIFQYCSSHAIHEEIGGGNAIVQYSSFFENPQGDFYDCGPVPPAKVYSGPDIPGGINNLYGDPLFVDENGDPTPIDRPLSGFYLSQIAAGQLSDSNAVDSGSDLAVNLGLDTYTTRTDGLGDTGQVDRGYHYRRKATLQRLALSRSVIGGHGSIDIVEPKPLDPNDPNNHIPSGDTRAYFYAGTTVTLKARPDAGWKVKSWQGTDNDTLKSAANTVTMISDRTVTVEFQQARTITVGPDGDYPTIESALFAADDGDIIVVYPGVWHGPEISVFKAVTIRSVDPNRPEDTIIDRLGYVDIGLIFYADATLDGFTIQHCSYRTRDGEDGSDPGENGEDGWAAEGGAIIVDSGVAPVIKNCIIKDNWISGGHGGNGSGADDAHNAGRGGWGGWGRGSGAYCAAYSSPTFINCQIIDNTAQGGNGGNGGDGSGPPDQGYANYGGNWSVGPGYNYDVPGINAVWVWGNLWEVWRRHSVTPWYDEVTDLWRWNYFGDYRWHSGYGGGVFCNSFSKVTFIKCIISGNRTTGGMSGVGGDAPGDNDPEPEFSYRLPSFGGGVYCAADSAVAFTNCEITNNTAAEPNESYHLDPYLGHGGGIAAEKTATLIFKNCTIGGNTATVGGGVYLADANPRIIDSKLTSNKAYHGGGLYGVDGTGTIIGCNIAGNQAFGYVTDPNGYGTPANYDPNNDYYLPGYGAGIHCDSTTMKIIDSNISYNIAGASGGGVFFTGENAPSLINCLVTNNDAGKGGGGVATSILSQPTIANCTIALNTVSGTYYQNRYGGGLECTYEGNTSIIDSILWGNSADIGPQIAIHNGVAAVTVNYSDVQNGAVGAFIDTGCILNWDDVNNLTGTVGDPDSEPRFVEGYYLSQPYADPNQTVLSPCVNRGSDKAKTLNMYRHTTRTDKIMDGFDPSADPNDHIVDIGYHYILTTTLVGDFNFDGIVDISDYAIFFDQWLEEGCEFPYWCQGTDLNEDGRVNYRDYSIFASSYLEEETTSPTPNPMTWAKPPTSVGLGIGAITMTATTATDNSGTGVQYKFECTYSGGSGGQGRDWDDDPNYTDSTVVVGKKYGYKVKARDMSANHNETGWSLIGYAIAGTGGGGKPAAPSGLAATAASSSSINLSWIDNSGNETGFKIESKTGGGSFSPLVTVGANVRSYSDSELTPETTYTYRVHAYNNEGDSDYSNEASATTPIGVIDTTAPLPNPSQWAVRPRRDPITGVIYMAAVAADDATTGGNNPVQYYFDCINGNGLDSGWQDSPIYSYTHPSNCTYVVRTKDNVGNVGADSVPAYTGE